MTDTSTPAVKPMWRRHKGACNQRVFNDPIDWEGHLRNCPHDIRRNLERLTETLKKLDLENRLDALEQADPAADPYAVEDSDPEQQSQYADDHDEDLFDIDHDDVDPAADNIRAFRPNDYFTGPGGGAA